jgi:hypothetical protein
MISATIRDIAIIIIALESIIIGALLGILVWQVWRLVKLLQREVQPILQNTQETINTVRGTTSFVSDNVVNPVVSASSRVAGMRRTLQVLGSGLSLRRTSPKAKP